MWVLLLLLGIVTTAAGLALVASAAMNDADVVTPAVAAVGGLLLIGLALVARELQRIELALVGRPGEATVAGASVAEASARVPFPPKPKINAPTDPVAAEAVPAPSAQPSPSAEPAAANPPPAALPSPAVPPAPALVEEGAFERMRAKFPTLVRREQSAVAHAPLALVIAESSAGAEADIGEVKKPAALAGGRANGSAPARIATRFDTKAHLTDSLERAKSSVFNAIWPAGPRRDAPTAPTHVAAPAPPPPSEPAAVRGTAHDSSPAAGDSVAPVSVLKSGVIEGMAYTLYSDGSIDAQVSQGKLRFGSISSLRNHIERGA